MIKRLIQVGFFTLLLFGILFGWRFLQIRQAMESHQPPPAPAVAVTRVINEQWVPRYSSIGSLVAVEGIQVSNELAGTVERIHFESGELVTRGQLLVELDTSTERAEQKRLEAALWLARIEHDRLKNLATSSFVSQSSLDEAKAKLEQAEAALSLQQALIDKKRIHAPFAGTLGIRRVDPGQYLPPGSSIVSLQTLNPLHADFSLPERYLAGLEPGQSIEIRVQAYPDRVFEGVVTAVNPSVDQATRNLTLRATLNNEQELLRPGMFAQVVIRLGDSQEVLTLPDTAITFNTYGDSVFLVVPTEGGHKVERRQVITGRTRDGRVEVLGGLEAGQTVVSAGQVKLRDGIPVRIDDQPAPGERPAPDGDAR